MSPSCLWVGDTPGLPHQRYNLSAHQHSQGQGQGQSGMRLEPLYSGSGV